MRSETYKDGQLISYTESEINGNIETFTEYTATGEVVKTWEQPYHAPVPTETERVEALEQAMMELMLGGM